MKNIGEGGGEGEEEEVVGKGEGEKRVRGREGGRRGEGKGRQRQAPWSTWKTLCLARTGEDGRQTGSLRVKVKGCSLRHEHSAVPRIAGLRRAAVRRLRVRQGMTGPRPERLR